MVSGLLILCVMSKGLKITWVVPRWITSNLRGLSAELKKGLDETTRTKILPRSRLLSPNRGVLRKAREIQPDGTGSTPYCQLPISIQE